MKTLDELLKGVDVIETGGDLSVEVKSVEYDSRNVRNGSVFVAIRGFNLDGTKFIKKALENGAVAIVTDNEKLKLKLKAALVVVENARKALAQLSSGFYEHPSKQLKIVGITGTNGKTTTSYLVESIISESGRSAGLIGTINYKYKDIIIESQRTTPEASDLQRMFRSMVDKKLDYCVMEVSSHSIQLDRVTNTKFELGVFTNLTQDHLDFHEDKDDYFNAKQKLFMNYGATKAVINIDDPYGVKLNKNFKGNAITIGIKTTADITAQNINISMDGVSFVAATPLGRIIISSELIGTHNVYNILCAIGAGILLDLPLEKIRDGINRLSVVPGRFEKIDEGQNYCVVVDYAHTDDALLNSLEAAKKLTKKKVIVLFGCGGDRDTDKRPKMGEMAGKYANFTVITSDNPRSENPVSIIRDIEKGIKKTSGKDKFISIPDREEAIEYAIKMARAGDLVLIAGKGHEMYQIFADRQIDFNDGEIARRAIKEKL